MKVDMAMREGEGVVLEMALDSGPVLCHGTTSGLEHW